MNSQTLGQTQRNEHVLPREADRSRCDVDCKVEFWWGSRIHIIPPPPYNLPLSAFRHILQHHPFQLSPPSLPPNLFTLHPKIYPKPCCCIAYCNPLPRGMSIVTHPPRHWQACLSTWLRDGPGYTASDSAPQTRTTNLNIPPIPSLTMPGFSQATDLAAWKALTEHHDK